MGQGREDRGRGDSGTCQFMSSVSSLTYTLESRVTWGAFDWEFQIYNVDLKIWIFGFPTENKIFLYLSVFSFCVRLEIRTSQSKAPLPSGSGVVLYKFLGGGCAAWTLEPLAYSKAGSAEFCYPVLG